MIFRDRTDAGRRLARALQGYAPEQPIVLALPRGGVPVAFEVAQALGAPPDLLLGRQIGAPGHEELGFGAVVGGDHPEVVLNDAIVAEIRVPHGYIEAETARQLKEI